MVDWRIFLCHRTQAVRVFPVKQTGNTQLRQTLLPVSSCSSLPSANVFRQHKQIPEKERFALVLPSFSSSATAGCSPKDGTEAQKCRDAVAVLRYGT